VALWPQLLPLSSNTFEIYRTIERYIKSSDILFAFHSHSDIPDSVVVDNDFERAYSIKPIKKANLIDLTETIYILEAVLNENNIDINKIYGDLK